MLRILSDRYMARRLAIASALVVLTGQAAQAQEVAADRPAEIISSQIEISRDQAKLMLELPHHGTVEFSIRDGAVWADGKRLGEAGRNDALTRSWRELLNQAMDAPAEGLATLLIDWEAPAGQVGEALDRALEAVLISGRDAAALATVEDGEASRSDTIASLQRRIQELESRLKDRSESHVTIDVTPSRHRNARPSALRHIGSGIAGIFSTVAVYAVLVGIGFAVVFFGRKYLEGVADTARHEPIRSGLVGLAASFLLLPGFILGVVALAISIVGIPLILVWVPLFPVAVVLAAGFGYLGVAHAMGEAVAERRFYGGEWFKRANSYYYVLTGVGLLLALYLAASVVRIGGPWLGFFHGMLMFLAGVLTWIVLTIGFGAVLISRAGSRPRLSRSVAQPDLDTGDLFEETHV